jgi:CheY-like chemotaxis protein
MIVGTACAGIRVGTAGKVVLAGLPGKKTVAWCFVLAQDQSQSKNVLVVEDNADDVELLQIAAKAAPDAVAFHIVRDGEQALAYLKGEGPFADRQAHPLPRLILLDLSLPGIDGFEVLAWIRQHPELNSMKVFVWTDSGDPKALDRAIKAGANRFVPKSVSFVRGGLAGLVTGISQAIPSCAAPESQAQTDAEIAAQGDRR